MVSPFFVKGRGMTVQTVEAVQISEIHNFKGRFPEIPTNHPEVDEQALLCGDTDPLYLNLPLAEIGKRSANGVLYDEALVTTIAEQLPGLGGGRGHIPEGQEDSAFPLEEVFWVGHVIKDNVLWAKGYVPPGRTREFIIRKKAIGGRIGTSIYGKAIREMDTVKRAFRLRDLVLEYVDLAPDKRASLKNERGFQLTKETIQSDEGVDPMPDKAEVFKEMTAADIALLPQSIREAIISEAKLKVDAQRVSELESQVAEMRQYATVIGEIRGMVGPDADVSKVIAEYHKQMTKMSETLGVTYTNIGVRVEEMHEQVKEMKQAAFTRAVGDKVAEFTNWNATKDDDKKRLEQIRSSFSKRLSAEVNGDTSKVAETAQRVWTDEFQLIGEMFVQSLGGPAAIVKPSNSSSSDDWRKQLETPEGLAAIKGKFGG
jgi:hypothetical protein